jgi:hypothetical protein
MADVKKLKSNVELYFSQLKTTNDLPTPPGFALAIGLRSFNEILRIEKQEREIPGTYPEESMAILDMASSIIEDMYIKGGLKDQLHPAFTKFILSAFYRRNDKTTADERKDTKIYLHIEGVSDVQVMNQVESGGATAQKEINPSQTTKELDNVIEVDFETISPNKSNTTQEVSWEEEFG